MPFRRFTDHRKLCDGWGTCAFMFQEPSLAFHTSAVAGEGAIGSDDTVTRHHNPDGIWAVGQTDCPDCGWPADLFGEFRIRDRGAACDLSQSAPYLALKGRAVGLDGQVFDCRKISAEVASDHIGQAIGFAGWRESESVSSEVTTV